MVSSLVVGKFHSWGYAFVIAATLTVSLVVSLSFKPDWLWMDEVLSYQLISDASLTHMNAAVVSGMDANPPLFPNLYWLIGQVSLEPQFLRAVSILLFGVTVGLFFHYTTRLVGTPRANAVLVTLALAFTFLNFTLSTQIRSYSLFLLVAFGSFVAAHRLIAQPGRRSFLVAHALSATALLFTHNFGLFYLAASGGFFAACYLWSRRPGYLKALGTHLLALLIWAIVWYPNFAVQAEAGKPHSWIPLPTLASFFATAGELVPSLSSQLERSILFPLFPVLRFGFVLALFLYLAVPRLKRGFAATIADPAFTFYLFSGAVYFAMLVVPVVVSFAHTSIFISRYLWPSHFLLIYQLVYAFHRLTADVEIPRLLALRRWMMPVYFAGLAAFVFFQNRKLVIFPYGIVDYLTRLEPAYPVFVETADYFLPIWFHRKEIPVHYVLDWESASRPGNLLSTTVEHKILKGVADHYATPGIELVERFNAETFPRFYAVDEDVVYGLESFIESGRVEIVRELPIAIKGHRLLECAFVRPTELAGGTRP